MNDQGQDSTGWPLVLASVTRAPLPVATLFEAAQRLEEGLTADANPG